MKKKKLKDGIYAFLNGTIKSPSTHRKAVIYWDLKKGAVYLIKGHANTKMFLPKICLRQKNKDDQLFSESFKYTYYISH